jgi:hypothetical protein
MRVTELLQESDDVPIIFDIIENKLKHGETIYLQPPDTKGDYVAVAGMKTLAGNKIEMSNKHVYVRPDGEVTKTNKAVFSQAELTNWKMVRAEKGWRLLRSKQTKPEAD